MASEVYDEEFLINMKLAKALTTRLSDREEQDIAKKWIQRICELKSSELRVKRSRNALLNYMIAMVQECLKMQIIEEEEAGTKKSTKRQFKCAWSPDEKTYVAVQPLPNQGAMIYMACSAVEGLGWDVPKLKRS